ncbi:MAG: dockerin type I domain-containing protein [Candidatus Hydrogenedens sp.]
MNNKLKTTQSGKIYLLQRFIIFALLLFPFISWGAIDAIPGDVNKDGVIDILDVQNGINIAIGINAPVPMADVNQNDMVDVLDIQTLINSVLGTGGLVQPLEGQIASTFGNGQQGTSPLFVALSEDGRIITSEISPDGIFQMLLPVGTTWAFGMISNSGNGLQSFPILAPTGPLNSLAIPLLQLSTGKPLQLNNLNLQQSNIPIPDLRNLLGRIAEPLPDMDENGNQIPDIYEQLINEIKTQLLSIPYLQTLGFNENLINTLLQSLGTCIQPHKDTLLTPSLNRIEIDGYPEMVLPLIQCFQQMIKNSLIQLGVPGPESITNLIMNQFQTELQQQIMAWLDSLQIPEVTDTNRNHIPDFIENQICNGNHCKFDLNNNGIPDFIEDSDGDSIPNYLDPDNRTEQDWDGDGIPNEQDIDANGNGILDYAENQNKE